MKATLRALNEERWTVAAFAVFGFGITLLQSIAYFQLTGHTFAERAAVGYSLSLEAAATAVLSPPAVHAETVGGYLDLRAFEPIAILFAAWAAVSATAASRQPIVVRAGAFAIAVAAAATAACIGTIVGVVCGGGSISAVGLLEAGLLLVALAAACYAICLIAGQTAPAPTTMASALLLILFFLDGLSRVYTQLSAVGWLSPFHWYDLSAPLPPGGHFDVGGLAALVAIALLGVAVAYWASTRRLDRVHALGQANYEPPRASLLAVPVARYLYPERAVLAGLCVIAIALGSVLAAAARTSIRDVLALPSGLPGLHHFIVGLYALHLDETWFESATLLMAAVAFAFIARWTAEDRDGRLEVALSAPITRSAIAIERAGAIGLTAAALAALSGLAVAIVSSLMNVPLDSTRLAVGCVLLAVYGVVLGSVGSLLTSWVPRMTGTLFGALLLAGYLDDQIGGALGLPGWAQEISPFRLVGDPLSNGVDGHNMALLLALGFAGLGSSILAMQRHDVGAQWPTKSSQART